MSPIDDELRAALHGRASALAPSPDPLAGIERRAKRIQRNRIGAAVAASALAVSAIAVAVPALQSATSSGPTTPNFATAAPSTQPALSRYALDPANPWTYRGDPQVLENGNLETVARDWGVRHRMDEAQVRLSPLYGELYEPSQQITIFYVAVDADGQAWWGVAQSSEGGGEFLVDQELADDTRALPLAVTGDEVPRLVVVAAPEVGQIEYAHDDASEFVAMEPIADGVAVTPLEGDPATDSFRVLDPQGKEVVRAPAPGVDGTSGGEPASALDPEDPWDVRGDRSLVTDGQLQSLGEDWAQRHGVDPQQVTVQSLYVQRYEPSAMVEVVYLVRFADNPWMWGVSALGEDGWSWYAENELRAGTSALAAALPGDEGVERLLVVAAPSTGGAMYAADGSDLQPMTDLEPGVFISPIAPGDSDDRYVVLDGDGDLDRPLVDEPAPDYQNAG